MRALSTSQSSSGAMLGALGMEGGRVPSVSISPNFLCLSLGTWSIEASYQSATKQKFKTAFDVKEYGELEIKRRSHSTATVYQGLSWGRSRPGRERC